MLGSIPAGAKIKRVYYALPDSSLEMTWADAVSAAQQLRTRMVMLHTHSTLPKERAKVAVEVDRIVVIELRWVLSWPGADELHVAIERYGNVDRLAG